MERASATIALSIGLLLLLSSCGPRDYGYDVSAILRDLTEMLQQPANLSTLSEEYRRTPDFKNFLRELRADLRGSAVEASDTEEILERALDLVRQHHLEQVFIRDPLLLSQYHADIFIVLLALEETEIERFLVGLYQLTTEALGEEGGVRPEVLAGLQRALRALRLRQPFLGASPPYAAQTYEDRQGEIPAAVKLAMRLRQEGWRLSGFYEEGRAKITRRFNHLQAVIDLVAAAPPGLAAEQSVALFLQVEQLLDGTNHDLKQVADRVEATASYIQRGGWREDFELALGSKPVVTLVIEQSGSEFERLWAEIEDRVSFLTEPIPILMADGAGGFRTLNLTEPEAQELLHALGFF